MEKIQLIFSLGAPLLGFFSTTIIVLKKYVKNNKLKKALERSEEILNKLILCVTEAENHSNYSGEEKKEYVMTKINQYAIENNIVFDSGAVSNKIEELIKLSKSVNNNKHELGLLSNNKEDEPLNKTSDIANAIQNIINGLKE